MHLTNTNETMILTATLMIEVRRLSEEQFPEPCCLPQYPQHPIAIISAPVARLLCPMLILL